jgi:hypothetical protein
MMSEDDCKISELTARDYFAMHVLPGIVTYTREMFMDNTYDDWVSDALPEMVLEAYEIADLMLKAKRGKLKHWFQEESQNEG